MSEVFAVPYTGNSVLCRQQRMNTQPVRSIFTVKDERVLSLSIPAAEANGKALIIKAGAAVPSDMRMSAVFCVIQEMVEWIDRHLDQALSVEKIAERSGYSVWHFQRKFVQFTGLNVYHYVRVRRVINATYALVNSEKRILEIAIDNGFNCQASFTRTVRGITGYTPASIRSRFSADRQQWLKLVETLLNP